MGAAAVASSSFLVSFSTPGRSPAASSLRFSPSSPSPRLPPPPRSCSSTSSIAKQQQQRQVVCLAVPRRNSALSSRSRCSSAATDRLSTVVSSERWLLEPAGDGDWRHIGYKVPRPGAFEIASEEAVTVGRVPEKADVVLPVATVSGVHARLEKKDGNLVVTDMDSTNGTYVNERKLVPGFAVAVDPGSLLIFGDVHLAMFRVRKMVVDVPREADGDGRAKTEVSVSASAAEETS